MIKKRVYSGFFIILILALILNTSLIISQETTTPADSSSGSSPTLTPEDTTTSEIPDEFAGEFVNGVTDLRKELDSAVEREITIPKGIELFTKIIFGLKGKMPLSIFIIILSVWFVFLFVTHSIIELTPFASRKEDDPKPWLMTFVICCIFSVTGIISFFSFFLWDIKNFIKGIETVPTFGLLITMGFVVVIFLGLNIALRFIERQRILAGGDLAARKVGAGMRIAKEAYRAAAEND